MLQNRFTILYVSKIKETGTSATRQRLSSKSDEGIEKSCNFRHHSKRIMAAAALRALRQSLPPSLSFDTPRWRCRCDRDHDTTDRIRPGTRRGEERSAATDTADDGGFVFHLGSQSVSCSCVRIRSRSHKSIPPPCIDLRSHTDDLLPRK